MGNVITMLARPKKSLAADEDAAHKHASKPVADSASDHIGVQLATFPKLLVAAMSLYFLTPYFGKFDVLSLDWIAQIFVRDLIITFLTAGSWDFLLYGPFRPASMSELKFNPDYPEADRFTHDIFYSTISTLISSVLEVAILHGVALGFFPAFAAPAGGAWWGHLPTLTWIVSMPYWRIAHFHLVHRAMHKWFPTREPGAPGFPDIGFYLYEWVHSLHHKSRNMTSFSGISMHPVESTLYYTAMFIPVLFGAHPILFLYTKADLTMAALIGHSGFAFPGGGSQTHWLHHHHINCNYSENYFPLDAFFGTFARVSEDAEKIRKGEMIDYSIPPEVAATSAASGKGVGKSGKKE